MYCVCITLLWTAVLLQVTAVDERDGGGHRLNVDATMSFTPSMDVSSMKSLVVMSSIVFIVTIANGCHSIGQL